MPNAIPTKRVTPPITFLLLVHILVAVALPSRLAAPTASTSVHLWPDWDDKWGTGRFGGPICPPRRHAVAQGRGGHRKGH